MRARPSFGMMPWMAHGDSRSIYIVQRTFTRVRRGYDPEEEDRAAADTAAAEAALENARDEAEQERLMAQARADAEAAAAERDRLLTDAREVLAAAHAEHERLLAAAAEEVATAHEAARTQIEAERAAGTVQLSRAATCRRVTSRGGKRIEACGEWRGPHEPLRAPG